MSIAAMQLLPSRVLQRHGARFCVNPVLHQLELRQAGGMREQWNSIAQQHGNNCHLDGINKAELEHVAKEMAATEQPDVFSWRCTKLGHGTCNIVGNNDALAIALIERT